MMLQIGLDKPASFFPTARAARKYRARLTGLSCLTFFCSWPARNLKPWLDASSAKRTAILIATVDRPTVCIRRLCLYHRKYCCSRCLLVVSIIAVAEATLLASAPSGYPRLASQLHTDSPAADEGANVRAACPGAGARARSVAVGTAHSAIRCISCGSKRVWQRCCSRNSRSGFPVSPLLEPYVTYFTAYSFTLARGSEYEANRNAARLASSCAVRHPWPLST
jgi:hypothetical protein